MSPSGKYYFPMASEDIFTFQKANRLRATGTIDSATRKALLDAGFVEQDVPSNLRAIVAELKKLDPQQGKGGYSPFSDPQYLKAVVGNVIKESQGKLVNEDLLNWRVTNNDRWRQYFGERIVIAFGPERLKALLPDMRKRREGIKYPPDPNANVTPEEVAAQDSKINALKGQSVEKFMEQWAEVIYGADTDIGKSLGNTAKGDGWKYRGRGFIGITGKSNYRARSQEIFGDDRLVSDPELINDPKYGAVAAALYLRKGEARMRQLLNIPAGPLNEENARILVSSQISGGDIRNKTIAKEILGKVQAGGEQYAAIAGVTGTAKDGGVFDGPMSGYNILMHGNEAVIPLKNGSVPVTMPRDFITNLADVKKLVSKINTDVLAQSTALPQIDYQKIMNMAVKKEQSLQIASAFKQLTEEFRQRGEADRKVIDSMLEAHQDTAALSQKILQTAL
jgi:hypothetical protein